MKNKPWGKNPKNPVILETRDLRKPNKLWEIKIPEWWARQKTLNTLPQEEAKGWPFCWFASWEPGIFQEMIAWEIQERISAAEYYFNMMIEDPKHKISVGKLNLEMIEKSKKLIILETPHPQATFDPENNEHKDSRHPLQARLSYETVPDLNTFTGDLIIYQFIQKPTMENWETFKPHTPWNQIEL